MRLKIVIPQIYGSETTIKLTRNDIYKIYIKCDLSIYIIINMTNPFEYKSYRDFLKNLCATSDAKRGFQSQLSRAAGCQAAYFSQVLKQKVHLTEDQIYALSEDLDFSSAETNFFILLLRYEKAGTEKLREYILKEIDLARANQDRLSARVIADQIVYSEEDLAKYFASWIPSVIHVATSSDRFRNVEQIAQRLGLSQKDTKDVLTFLAKKGWVKQIGQEYHYSSGNIHIVKESPLHSTMQVTRRHLVLNSIAQCSPESIHYSSVFTLDRKSYEELKKISASFIQKSAKQINDGGTDELYTLTLDLFQVV